MSFRRLSFAPLLAAALSGCGAYYSSTTPFNGQGNSVRQNNAVMIIDPQPSGAADTNIDMDGRRALVAIERYHTNSSLEPTELRTTEDLPVVGEGSGSGDDGSGGDEPETKQ